MFHARHRKSTSMMPASTAASARRGTSHFNNHKWRILCRLIFAHDRARRCVEESTSRRWSLKKMPSGDVRVLFSREIAAGARRAREVEELVYREFECFGDLQEPT